MNKTEQEVKSNGKIKNRNKAKAQNLNMKHKNRNLPHLSTTSKEIQYKNKKQLLFHSLFFFKVNNLLKKLSCKKAQNSQKDYKTTRNYVQEKRVYEQWKGITRCESPCNSLPLSYRDILNILCNTHFFIKNRYKIK